MEKWGHTHTHTQTLCSIHLDWKYKLNCMPYIKIYDWWGKKNFLWQSINNFFQTYKKPKIQMEWMNIRHSTTQQQLVYRIHYTDRWKMKLKIFVHKRYVSWGRLKKSHNCLLFFLRKLNSAKQEYNTFNSEKYTHASIAI